MSDAKSKPRLIIGGVTGGIGSAVLERAVSAGWQVAGYGSNEERFEELRGQFSAVTLVQADATDSQSLRSGLKQCAEALGGVDAYVHAIGSVFLKPGHQTRDEEWRQVMAVNLDSAFFALRELVPVYRSGGGGSIVFFSSVAARMGLANHEAIAAAKAGIEGLVRSAAATYVTLGIRVNAIAPGLVETGATTRLLANEVARQTSCRMHPLGRVGTAAEVAGLAIWLASAEASWVTGQVMSMDGGMSTVLQRLKS
jgi:NAD(P)-dependent dehydrogenase (short-subunit alcohol dehydrogenase family)